MNFSWIWACCGGCDGGDSGNEESDERAILQHPEEQPGERGVVTEQPEQRQEMPIDVTKSKAKLRTYGKKTSKFPASSEIFTEPNNGTPADVEQPAHAPRDPLTEITKNLSNIRINVPEVTRPEEWVDPDEAPLVSKGKVRQKPISEAEWFSNRKLKKTSNLPTASNAKPSANNEPTSKGEGDLQTPRVTSSKRSLRSKGPSANGSSENDSTKGERKRKELSTPKADSFVSRRSPRVPLSGGSSLGNSTRGSKFSSISKGKITETDTASPKPDVPARSLRSHVSRGSSLDNSSIDEETLLQISKAAKGKGKQVAEVEVDESPARSQPSLVSRGSSADNSSVDLERLHISDKQKTAKPKSSTPGPASSSIEPVESPKTPSRRKSGLKYNQPKSLLSPYNAPDPGISPWLKPLVAAYSSGPRTTELTRQDWTTILADVDNVTKIAEASFAEVYRVEVADESSILKIITLRPPKGPGSKRTTAIPVQDVISEFRIMDAMSELDGFLELKDAYLIGGKPTAEMIEAHELFRKEEEERKGQEAEWYFPHPSSYQRETMFFVLEMVDAGKDLGKFKIQGLVQVFDFFLQLAISLDAGERYFGFEHRDIHENNVCIQRRKGDPEKKDKVGERYKLYVSGYEITILDFTLSRAQVGPNAKDVVYYDLDADMALFGGQGNPQYQVYRDMRTHLLTQTTATTASSSATDPDQYLNWSQPIPYTNVLWLRFLLGYMIDRYHEINPQVVANMKKIGGRKNEEFEARMEELDELRDLLWSEDGSEEAFACAGDVVEYALGKSWIAVEDRL